MKYIMKRHTKGTDGKYHTKDGSFDVLVGSRAQVFHGTAYKTTYSAVKPKGDALKRKHLKMNKHGRVVSKAKSRKGAETLKRLHKKGYFTRKGHFGWVEKSPKKTARRRTKRRSRSAKRSKK